MDLDGCSDHECVILLLSGRDLLRGSPRHLQDLDPLPLPPRLPSQELPHPDLQRHGFIGGLYHRFLHRDHLAVSAFESGLDTMGWSSPGNMQRHPPPRLDRGRHQYLSRHSRHGASYEASGRAEYELEEETHGHVHVWRRYICRCGIGHPPILSHTFRQYREHHLELRGRWHVEFD